ncbi:MAG: MGMT family protein [Candidatus Magnetomorum sp.]|nr:MGMT family protein [Candidatus Magnetomorum sp.]
MTVCRMVFQTAFGYAAAAYVAHPFQLHKVYLPRQTRNIVMDDIFNDFEIIEGHHPNIDILVKHMQHYFQGHPIQTPWAWLKWDTMTSLQAQTLKQTAQIPFGAVCTYQQLAQNIGRPKAVRFVGSCMARNPYPIIIPCHRVIRSDGSIGQFGGGASLKKRLLALEQTRAS